MNAVEVKDTVKEATPVEEVKSEIIEEPEDIDLTDALDEAMNTVEVKDTVKETTPVEEVTPEEKFEDVDLTDELDEAMDNVEVETEKPKEEYEYDIEEIEEETDKPKKKEGKLKKLLNKIKNIPAVIKSKISKKSKKKKSKKKEGFFKKLVNKFKKPNKGKKKEGFFKKLANKAKKHIIPAKHKDERSIKAKNKKETKKEVKPEVDLTQELDDALDKITVNDSTSKDKVVEKDNNTKESTTDNKVKIEEEIIAKPIEKPVTKIEEEIIAKPIEKPVTKIEEEIIAKPIEKNISYKAMNAEEIKNARRNIEANKYDYLYSRSKDELLSGTDVIKPRDKYLCETDEEYLDYVRDYMERHFPVDQPKEYIPGTDILKPRNRGTYESNEEYEEYLRMYYDYYLTPKMEEQKEDVTIYSDAETNYLYVTEAVADKYELRSARFPAKINESLCYRISMEDARRLVEEENCNVKIELYQRKYERTDEEYLSFDKPKVLTK